VYTDGKMLPPLVFEKGLGDRGVMLLAFDVGFNVVAPVQ
jgi:hypothetical protein